MHTHSPDTSQLLEQTIARVTHLISNMESNAFRQEGFSELSMRQVLYMDMIAQLEHPSFGELADALGVTRPSVTSLVGKLIVNGYVEKVQDGTDRRSFHIILTTKGQKFTQMHQNIHRMVVQALISHLDTTEIEQFLALLNKAIG